MIKINLRLHSPKSSNDFSSNALQISSYIVYEEEEEKNKNSHLYN